MAQRASFFGTTQFSPWASCTDYIVTNGINSAQDVFPMMHTLTIVEPIWPILQKKKNSRNIEDCDELHHINVCTNSEQWNDATGINLPYINEHHSLA